MDFQYMYRSGDRVDGFFCVYLAEKIVFTFSARFHEMRDELINAMRYRSRRAVMVGIVVMMYCRR